MRSIITFFKLFLFISLFIACKTASVEATQRQMALQKQFAENLKFTIVSNAAKPLVTVGMSQLQNSGIIRPGSSISRFDLTTIENHLIMDSTQVDLFLPYYGERRMGGGYNTDAGIKYKGPVKDLVVEHNKDQGFYIIEFGVRDKTESLDIKIRLYQNLKTHIYINSTQRTSINYDGFAAVNENELDKNNKPVQSKTPK